jgi:hypothetical protein
MTPNELTFGQLVEHVELSSNTVRRIVRRLRLKPRRVGTAHLYTREQARAIEAEHQTNGGRWPVSSS